MTAWDDGERVVTWSEESMGGTLNVTICAEPEHLPAATEAARRTARRVEAWAARLTRFAEQSDLSRLNTAGGSFVGVRPTLAAALTWAKVAQERSLGIVDVTLLDARLASELGPDTRLPADSDAVWQLEPSGRRSMVRRSAGVRFDLDGVAKGWIADRAAELLSDWQSVAVDADGDVSLRLSARQEWLIDVLDPREQAVDGAAHPLVTLRLCGGDSWSRTFGIATSGTSVHRWQLADGRSTHHLIDPRTRRSAETNVVQATVVAPSAREAEMLAKAAVILGSESARSFLNRSAAQAAVLLLESGDLISLPGVEKWLA